MWTKKNFINVLFLFLALLWFSPCVGGCSPTYTITGVKHRIEGDVIYFGAPPWDITQEIK